MVIQRGDIVWVSLPPPRGSEPAGRRPVLVIQSDAYNRSRLNTVIVAVITSNLRLEGMPGNVKLAKGEAGMSKPSVINVTQIHAVDRQFIESRIGTISSARLEQVRAGLLEVLGLGV